MDRKAIESYANEISLLKSLRNNPSIIQMYDSQVDRERKAIFVVMELGEVDLNHVLQQQMIASSSESAATALALRSSPPVMVVSALAHHIQFFSICPFRFDRTIAG